MGESPAKPTDKLSPQDRKMRMDSFLNSLTGLGDPARDKRLAAVPSVVVFSQQQLEDLYRGTDLAATLVEALPDEMTREGWHVQIEDDEDDQDESVTSSNAKNDAFPTKPSPAGGGPIQARDPKSPDSVPPQSAKNKGKGAELAEEVNKYLESSGFTAALKETLYWSRIYGGAGCFMLADDGNPNLQDPLDLTKVKTITGFTPLSKYELLPMWYYGDPLAPNYGHVSVFYLQQLFGLPQDVASVGEPGTIAKTPGSSGDNGVAVPLSNSTFAQVSPRPIGEYSQPNLKDIPANQFRSIHESRLLLFDGVPVTRRQRIINKGWGDSIFTRVFEVLRDYEASWAGICHLMQDFAQAVIKLRHLNELMTGNDDGVVARRAQLFDMTRSIVKGVLLDAGDADGVPAESFERVVTPLTGIPEIMDQMASRLAAAARMPKPLLMGQAPAGLNATGDSDIRYYYDRIKSKQQEELLPNLTKFMKVVFAAKDGPTGGVEPENWSIVFDNLWQLSDDEEATRRYQIAQADAIYMTAGVVTPDEVATSRFGSDTYQGETIHLDSAARAKFGAGSEEHLKAQAAGLQGEQGNNPDGTPKPPEPSPIDVIKAKAQFAPPAKGK